MAICSRHNNNIQQARPLNNNHSNNSTFSYRSDNNNNNDNNNMVDVTKMWVANMSSSPSHGNSDITPGKGTQICSSSQTLTKRGLHSSSGRSLPLSPSRVAAELRVDTSKLLDRTHTLGPTSPSKKIGPLRN